MIKLIRKSALAPKAKTKLMKDMKPLEVCVVLDDEVRADGHTVMRTASRCTVEVMDLTCASAGGCWDGNSTVVVRELYPGEKYLLELS